MTGATTALIVTAAMVPVSYCLTRLAIWVASKIDEVTEWERGFYWGLLFWAMLFDGLIEAFKLYIG